MSKPARILIATDAWHPQVNGVVRTLDNITQELRKLGHEVFVFSHQGKKTWAMPSYSEIELAYFSQSEIDKAVREFQPDFVHIATEGPLGFCMRRYCLKNKLDFTTGYHTRFAEYVQTRIPIPGIERAMYALLRWFHRPSKTVLAPTKTISQDLTTRGFENVISWTRGVDHKTFKDYGEHDSRNRSKPILLYVGRLAVEKGIEDFLNLDYEGTKLVIGDGPSRESLQRKYREAIFTGYMFGEALARKINTADVFVFPSRTDTFGLVMIEAMACGVPVAAYPVMGPIDVVEDGYSGALDEDLSKAITRALKLKREDAKTYAAGFTWKNTARVFFEHLAPINSPQTNTKELTAAFNPN